MKQEKAKIQSVDYSKYNLNGLFSFDREVITSPTDALIHQAARFLFLIEGDGVININGRKSAIKRGSLVAIMPWHHTKIVKVESTLKYFILKYNIDIVNKFVKYFHSVKSENILLETMYVNHVVNFEDIEMDYMLKIFLSIKDELGAESVFPKKPEKTLSDVYVIAKIIEIITIFVRKSESAAGAVNESIDESMDEYDLVNIFKYIYSHLSKNPRITDIANVFFTSPSTLSRYIKKTSGMNYETLLNEMKMAKARQMLLYTELSISQIADILGYTDQAHLTKVFNKTVNKSPGDYRKIFKRETLLFSEEYVEKFYKILNYLFENYHNNISIDTVSEKFGLTNYRLNKMFLYHVEKTFAHFLNYIRINNACLLLLRTKKSVTDIAFDVGYNNTTTFVRNFTKLRGMSPTKFRKDIKEQSYDI